MRSIKSLLALVCLLLSATALHARNVAIGALRVADARVQYADGTPYRLPPPYTDWHTASGGVFAGLDRGLLWSEYEGYSSWSAALCDGSCTAADGYASAMSSGEVGLGSPQSGVVDWRAAAMPAAGQQALAGVYSTYRLRFPHGTGGALVYAFDAAPYLELSLDAASPAGTVVVGAIRTAIDLTNLSTGEVLFHIDENALLRGLWLEAPATVSAFLYDPGWLSFSYSLGTLDPAFEYALDVRHLANVEVLPVPEPTGGALYVAGIGVLAMARWRRHAWSRRSGRAA